MDQLLQNPQSALALVLTAGAVAIVLIGLAVNAAMMIRRRREAERALQARELAVMVEDVRITGGGAICWVALAITVFGAIAGYNAAKTVFQQIEAGVSLIAGVMLFGLGAALGRRRTYRIYRSEQRTEL